MFETLFLSISCRYLSTLELRYKWHISPSGLTQPVLHTDKPSAVPQILPRSCSTSSSIPNMLFNFSSKYHVSQSVTSLQYKAVRILENVHHTCNPNSYVNTLRGVPLVCLQLFCQFFSFSAFPSGAGRGPYSHICDGCTPPVVRCKSFRGSFLY